MAETSHHNHVLPMRTYLLVGAALFVLTALTVSAAQIDLGAWNAIVAFVLAGTKAALVAMIFMHLKYDNRLFMVIFLIGIVFITLFIGLTMFDTLRRGDIDESVERPIRQEAVIYDQKAGDTSTAETAANTGTSVDTTVQDSQSLEH